MSKVLQLPDRYVKPRVLSTTLYGEAVLATDTSKTPQRQVVIKLSRLQYMKRREAYGTGGVAMDDPLMEAQVLRLFKKQPRVVNFITEFWTGQVHGLVLDYVSGCELISLLEHSKRLDEPRALLLTHQILQAAAAMHAKGYGHMDISPENVLVSEGDRVTLIDFGQVLPRTRQKPAKSQEFLPMKPRYRAPEVAAFQSYFPDKCDSFSIGVVLFCMVAGCAPWVEATQEDAHYAYFTSEHGGLRNLLEGLPPVSDKTFDLLEKLLQPNPDKRPVAKYLLDHGAFAGLCIDMRT